MEPVPSLENIKIEADSNSSEEAVSPVAWEPHHVELFKEILLTPSSDQQSTHSEADSTYMDLGQQPVSLSGASSPMTLRQLLSHGGASSSPVSFRQHPLGEGGAAAFFPTLCQLLTKKPPHVDGAAVSSTATLAQQHPDSDDGAASTPASFGQQHPEGDDEAPCTSASLTPQQRHGDDASTSQSPGRRHPRDDECVPSTSSPERPARRRSRLYFCDECEKDFSSYYTFERHKKYHSGGKSFKCKWCDKRYTLGYHLTRHVMVHTGEMPFKCEECGRKFLDHSHLQRHKNAHARQREKLSLTFS